MTTDERMAVALERIATALEAFGLAPVDACEHAEDSVKPQGPNGAIRFVCACGQDVTELHMARLTGAGSDQE